MAHVVRVASVSALRIGVTLPTFRDDAATALQAARAAEAAGLDGVFSFDHLWPMGRPDRPALSCLPVLAAVAARTERIRLGPLVARVGLLPDQVLLASLLGLAEIAGSRLLVAIGTGDSKSLEEHERNGLVYLGAAARHESLSAICRSLGDAGIESWVGAGGKATNDAARGAGVTLNFWGATPAQLAAEAAKGPVSWAGPIPGDAEQAARTLSSMADAGASWVVWGWPQSLETVVEAARLAGVGLGR